MATSTDNHAGLVAFQAANDIMQRAYTDTEAGNIIFNPGTPTPPGYKEACARCTFTLNQLITAATTALNNIPQ
jgi:hypothetical protein